MIGERSVIEDNQLTPDGLEITWYNDSRVLHILVTQITPASIDGWASLIDDVVTAWDTTQPLLTIHEFTTDTVIIPSSAQHTAARLANEIDERYPKLHGRAAVVIPPTAKARFMRVFLQTLKFDGPRRLSFEIFNNRQAALRWIEEPTSV